MIFALDTGNDKIKTEDKVTQAGLKKLDYVPEQMEDALFFEGNYYMETVSRLAYMYDKSVDDRYYILTLLALARELYAGGEEKYPVTNGLIEVVLLVGLPPAHYAALREKFENYFYRDGTLVSFVYKGKKYTVTFTEVVMNIQGYAVYLSLASKMRLNDYNKVCIIDFGGMTVDYLLLRYGMLDKSDSLEKGIITLYGRISSSINRRCNILFYVFEIAEEHVVEFLGIFREIERFGAVIRESIL